MGFTNPYPASRLTVDSTNSLVTGMQLWFPFTTGSGTSAPCLFHSSHDGTLQSGASWASGDIGTVLELNGSSEVDFTSDISRNKTAVSCSAWIKPDSVSSNHFVFFESNNNNSQQTRFGLAIVGGRVRCGGRDDDGDSFTIFAQSNTNMVVTGAWQHVVAVFDPTGGGCKVYLDGVDVTASSINTGDGFPDTASINQVVGGIGGNSAFYFDGQIQNLKVWDRAITAAEVATLYHRPWEGSNYGDIWPYSPPATGSMTLSTDTAATSLLSGMQAWFPLTQGSGTVAQCILHPSHTGTLGSGVTWESSERGTVASFDGTSNAKINFSSQLVSGQTLSFSVWLYVASSVTGRRTIYCDGATWVQNDFRYDGNGKRFVFDHYTPGGEPNKTSGDYGVDDRWIHVVVTQDSSTTKIYYDGVLKHTGTAETYASSAPTAFNIGSRDGSDSFDGKMQNFRAWDRVISADEVALLHSRPWEGIEYGDTFHHDPPAPASMLPLTSDAINTNQVGWWPLTETDDYASGAADISGGGNNGTPQSNAGSANTALGQVLEQPDANSYIQVGDVSALKITGALSISIWLKTDSSTPVNIVSKYHATTGGRAYSLHLNRPELEFNIDGTTVAQGATQIRGDDKWHHLVGVYDPSNFVRVYVDGVLDGEVTTGVPSSITDTSYPFNIGRAWNGGNVVGFLQNCRVWNRVLTADEIWSIYANPWLGSNYKLASGSTPLYNYIFRTERFRRLG